MIWFIYQKKLMEIKNKIDGRNETEQEISLHGGVHVGPISSCIELCVSGVTVIWAIITIGPLIINLVRHRNNAVRIVGGREGGATWHSLAVFLSSSVRFVRRSRSFCLLTALSDSYSCW